MIIYRCEDFSILPFGKIGIKFIIETDNRWLLIESSVVPREGKIYYHYFDQKYSGRLSNELEFLLCFGCTINAFLEAIKQQQTGSGWVF